MRLVQVLGVENYSIIIRRVKIAIPSNNSGMLERMVGNTSSIAPGPIGDTAGVFIRSLIFTPIKDVDRRIRSSDRTLEYTARNERIRGEDGISREVQLVNNSNLIRPPA